MDEEGGAGTTFRQKHICNKRQIEARKSEGEMGRRYEFLYDQRGMDVATEKDFRQQANCQHQFRTWDRVMT